MQKEDKTEEKKVMTMEEYLKRINVIRCKDTKTAGDKEAYERKTEETKRAESRRWSAVMELAELLYI